MFSFLISYIKKVIFIKLKSQQISNAVSENDYIQIPAKATGIKLKERKIKAQTDIPHVDHCDGMGGEKQGQTPYF